MKRNLAAQRLIKIALVYFLTLVFINCTPNQINESTDDSVNITGYIKIHEEYSLFLEALQITNYASFMNTFGSYTMFLPTNEAMKEYLTDLGVASLKDVPMNDLKDMVRLHILDQELITTSFTDGKIETPSQYGQYLVTGVTNIDGVSSTTVNKTSIILASNIEVRNGVIHVINKVLRVANKTLAQTIEANSDLSLFTEVLKATGWYDKLNQPVTYDENNISSHLTVLAETNQVYDKTEWESSPGTKITLNTLENLKLKYSTSADLTDASNGLNLYVQYHILPKLNYLADLAVSPVFETKAPAEVITSKLVKDVLYLNRDIFNGVLEEGFTVAREPSDVSCSNGVLHFVDQDFAIKKRFPLPVYFDLCNIKEFAANTANYRKLTGKEFGYPAAIFSDITWLGNQTLWLTYRKNSNCWNGDQLEISRLIAGTGGQQMVTFNTPVIIKGRYKVWVTYKQGGSSTTQAKVFINGVQMPRLINLREFANPISGTSYLTDRVLESQGYKRPMYPFRSNTINSRLVGIVEIETTGTHKISFHTDSSSGREGWFDFVEFRPIEMDQIWPKFQAGMPEVGGGGFVNREDAPTDN